QHSGDTDDPETADQSGYDNGNCCDLGVRLESLGRWGLELDSRIPKVRAVAVVVSAVIRSIRIIRIPAVLNLDASGRSLRDDYCADVVAC
ncbi:MAG TPA: hypothetical protein VJ596_04720, partial [Gemmatimonadaceae bacterium]|nr:hypothetical protein [Gemmatimonadaceae bacterium]